MDKDYNDKFSEIYDTYINKIYRFIYLKVNSKEIAQDLTSEVFLNTFKYLSKNNKIDNPQAFLYRAAYNITTDYYRKKGRTQMINIENLPLVDEAVNIEQKTGVNLEIEQVKIAIAKLNEDYQNLIIWHYLEDMPIKEIANILKKSEETTRVQLHRALKALKERVGHEE